MKVSFLVAEEARPEVSGKFTILGLFANNVIALKKRPETLPQNVHVAIDKVTILAIISEAPNSDLRFKGRIYDPKGDIFRTEMEYGSATIPHGFSHSIVIEIKPFVVTALGIYRFELFVNDQMFTCPIEIREELT